MHIDALGVRPRHVDKLIHHRNLSLLEHVSVNILSADLILAVYISVVIGC